MKNRTRTLFAAVGFCFVLPAILCAQPVDTAWVRRYNGPGNSDDYGIAIAVDDSGNVFVTGGASLAPWPAMDYATVKYDANGDTVWFRSFDGPGDSIDCATALAIDGQGNAYVTGYSVGPGSDFDYATIKYYPNGDTAWVRRYNGPGNYVDQAAALAVDSSGNVYVTGYSFYALTNYGEDYATIKYSPSGETLWVRRYNGPANSTDIATVLTIDGQGDVYVTGYSQNDYLTIKYDADGDTVWVRRYDGGQDQVRAIAVDDSGNVYVTGASSSPSTQWDYLTVKYLSNGDTAWARRYTGPGSNNDDARALKLDNSGNVYVTGRSVGTGSADDYVTIKYHTNGDTAWVRRYNGPGNSGDGAYAMAIDEQGSVYVTGQSFGSGPGDDFATVKYDQAGDQQWVARYNGGSWDQAHAIAVDNSGNVCVSGQSWTDSLWSYDRVTIKYVQLTGMEEAGSRVPPAEGLEVYPNPARAFLFIRLPLDAVRSVIRICDISGKVVKETVRTAPKAGDVVGVALGGLKSGVYFVRVGDKAAKQKLVIAR